MTRQDLYRLLDTDTKTNVIVNEFLDEMDGLGSSAKATLRRAIVTVLFHNRAPETGFFRGEIADLVDEVIADEKA